MKNWLKVDHENGRIIMDRTFAKKSENTMSVEYTHLQNVRRDYPNYSVIRREISKNPNAEHYRGLTYEYMKAYIEMYEPKETRQTVLDELTKVRFISQCHSSARRFPAVKSWFLDKYPEIAKFGLPTIEEDTSTADATENTIPFSSESKDEAA